MHDLDFNLTPSRCYLVLFSVILLLSLVVIMALPAALWMKSIAVLGFFIYGMTVLWRAVLLRSQQSITHLRLGADGRWQVTINQALQPAILRGDSTVTSLVSVLRFDLPTQRFPQSCVVFNDSLGVTRYRELLVALHMRPSA